MKTAFWSVITAILLLVLASLALYSGEAEIVSEPVPDNIAQLVGDLRAEVDALAVTCGKQAEFTALASAAGKGSLAQQCILLAEQLQNDAETQYNSKIITLQGRIAAANPPESAKKQADEFMTRARSLVAPESRRDLLCARADLGMQVGEEEWLALADRYEKMDNLFAADMGLNALAQVVALYDAALAGRIAAMVKSPFVHALQSGSVDGISDPWLRLQALIASGKSSPDAGALTEALGRIGDMQEQAFMAARILIQLPNLSGEQRQPFIQTLEAGDPLLVAETKMVLAEQGGPATGGYLQDVEKLLPEVAQFYPREQLLARTILAKSDDPVESLLVSIAQITGVTLRDQVLLLIVEKRSLSEPEFNSVIAAIHDNYSRLMAGLAYFKKSGLTGAAASKFLISLEAYTDGITEPEPLVRLAAAWAGVDGWEAIQSLSRFDTKGKVEAAVAIAEVTADAAAARKALQQVYEEVARARTFEQVEKSALLRQLAVAAMQRQLPDASVWLDEARRNLAQ